MSGYDKWGNPIGGATGGGGGFDKWGNPTQSAPVISAPKPSGGGGGFLGLVGNLGSDLYHTVTDSYAGAKQLGSGIAHGWTTNESLGSAWNDPKDILGMVHAWVANERHVYGSAIHGNFHPLYEHPLTPILDLATVLTAGGGAALRGSRLGAFGSKAADFARSDRVLQSENLADRLNTARTFQGRLRQNAYDRFSMQNPNFPVVGANARLAKIATSRAGRLAQRATIPVRDFQTTVAGLSRDEKFALHVAAEGVPLNERLNFFRSIPGKQAKSYVSALSRPGVAKALEDPSPRFLTALDKARNLEATAGQRLVDTGQLTNDIRANRAFLPQRMMREGEPVAENAINPSFGAPFRFPHVAEGAKPSEFIAPRANPLGKVKDLGQLKKNTGARLGTAKFLSNPEQVYARDYLSTMRHEHLLQIQHGVLDKVARPLGEEAGTIGGKLPNEHYYRPSYTRSSTTPIPRAIREEDALAQDRAVMHGETPTGETALGHAAGESVFQAHNAPADLREAIQNGDLQKLADAGVKRIPDAFGKRYIGQFGGTPAWARFLIDRPLDVWRAITLNARPAWMVNNLIGNNLQFFLRHPSGAESYLRALLRTERGDAKVVQLRNWTFKIPTLRRKYERIFNEVSPEIHSAGLYGTQTRVTNAGVYQPLLDRSAAVRAATKLALPVKAILTPVKGVARGITWLERHFAEDAPREAAMLQELHPFIEKLKSAGMSTEQALKSLDPRDVELAVDRMHDAMGDFNNLSATERRIVRRVIPFWSWYRVITTVSAKYAARYPGRVDFINAVAQQAASEDKNLPSWLQGEIQLGPAKGGVQPVLTTSGINPYQTLVQEVTSNPSSMLNPFAAAMMTGFTGKDTFGQDYKGWGSQVGPSPNLLGYLKRSGGAFAYDTVPGQLGLKLTGNAHNSKIYAPKTYGHLGPIPINDALLQYFGLPIRHVRVSQAKVDQRKGY